MHHKYGPVVRTAPNELSFCEEGAWLDIYGKPVSRSTQLPKDQQQILPPPSGVWNMSQQPSDEEHQRMRRFFAHGFSEKALRDQEPIMNKYFNLFIRRLHENCAKAVDINKWYDLLSFDVMSDLAFGESFGGLENSKLHPWTKSMQAMLRAIPVLGITQKYYPLDRILLLIAKPFLRESELKFYNFVERQVMKRLKLQTPRPDFLVYAQESLNTPESLTFQEICENAGLLMVGGAESTPSALAGVTYLLLCNPTCLAILTSCLRTTFQSVDEINSVTVNIDYLLAVLNEALRLYPPVPSIFSRVTPPEGCFIAGRYVPGNTSVSVSQRGINRSASNFVRPNEFAPQRWTGDAEFRDDQLKVVQPFSVGPRNCIGRNLAFFEMKLVLAKLLYSFDLELCEESRGWMDGQKILFFNVRPPLMIKLKPYVKA